MKPPTQALAAIAKYLAELAEELRRGPSRREVRERRLRELLP